MGIGDGVGFGIGTGVMVGALASETLRTAVSKLFTGFGGC